MKTEKKLKIVKPSKTAEKALTVATAEPEKLAVGGVAKLNGKTIKAKKNGAAPVAVAESNIRPMTPAPKPGGKATKPVAEKLAKEVSAKAPKVAKPKTPAGPPTRAAVGYWARAESEKGDTFLIGTYPPKSAKPGPALEGKWPTREAAIAETHRLRALAVPVAEPAAA